MPLCSKKISVTQLMVFIDQSATNLHLSVYDGDVDLSPLNIIKQTSQQLSPTLSLHMGIIGASHFIKVQYGSDFFTEIFACTDLTDFQSNKLYPNSTKELRNLSLERTNGLQYNFQHQFHALKEQALIYQELDTAVKRLSPKGIHLSFTFPQAHNNKLIARTITVADVSEDLSTIQSFTIHEYPQEKIIVTNRSRFSFTLG